MAIGNGWVDPYHQELAYADYMHMNGMISDFEFITNSIGFEACKVAILSGVWPVALAECNALLQTSMAEAEGHLGRSINIYNWKEKCNYPPLCYNFTNIQAYLAQPQVRQYLTIPSQVQWTEVKYFCYCCCCCCCIYYFIV